MTRDPSGIRRALEKLQADVTVVQRTSHATSHLWIESPDDTEKGHRGSFFNRMYETHPPLAERIEVLRRMEGLAPASPPVVAAVSPAQGDAGLMMAAAATPATSWTEVVEPATATGLAEPTGQPILPPSGWYADPADAARVRWWDGARWTDHVADRVA